MQKHHWRQAALLAGAGLGTLGLAYGASRLATQYQARDLDTFRVEPTTSYADAVDLLAQLQARDGELVNPLCNTQFLTHGQKTERVIVLYHGITNCPRQFVELAPLFYEQGYNVLVPRMPHNGLKDRNTRDIGNLTAAELSDFANMTIDIASGLGEHITVAGLSAGGVVAAWIAQHRAEVEKAVLIAPSFGIGNIGVTSSVLSMYVLLTLPNILTSQFKPFEAAPAHAYLGYSTRALGEVMRLGASVYRHALKHKPAVQSLLLVTNQNDTAVAEKMIWRLIEAWQKQGLQHLQVYQFPTTDNLQHDLIDPRQDDQHVDIVYPRLLELITGA